MYQVTMIHQLLSSKQNTLCNCWR